MDGKIYIIDMNPRFGGDYPATHMAGVNLLELLVRLINDEDIEPEFHNYAIHLLVTKDVSLQTKQMQKRGETSKRCRQILIIDL